MRFGVLGPLTVWTTDGRPVTVPEAKTRALLADLLAHDGRAVPADRLIDDLWGAELPDNPANTLQGKVSQLRRALGEAEPGGRELVVYRPPGYLLRVESDAVDAHRFTALASRAGASDDPRVKAALLSDALALWRGPAFADFGDEEFTRAAITRLEEHRLTALEEQAEARLELGEHHLLAGELGELVTRYPLRERLRAAHLRALYRSGRQSEALDSYHELRGRLVEELGLDPSPDLVALHQAILEQDPALAAVPAPSTPAARPRTNLPAALTELVGRSDAVAEVRSLLDAGRLVTLTGPGGVGKTRLAVEAATASTDTFPDGAWLVELAALDQAADGGTEVSRAGVVEEVAVVLGVRDDAPPGGDLPPGDPVDLTDRLAGALRTKQMLLVLDGCEHVIEPVAKLAELLLRAAPGLRVLATSQEPFGISGELVWTVPPLEVPAGTNAQPDLQAAVDPAFLLRFSAVQLFVGRAAAAAPGFSLDSGNAGAVATICRRLDGIPLALELAATRVRAMGAHELAARLGDRFHLLTAEKRGAPARQRTLRAMIDWSWELLAEPERVVLRRLAVHADGCTLEAAEEICAGEDVRATEVLDLLARLVDRSLVVVTDDGDGARYRLLESVAAYCVERLLEAGEYELVQQRHLRYYTALAECAEAHLRDHAQHQWLRRMDAEAANLRSALDGAARQRAAGLALRLAGAMAWYWFLRGRLGEARRSLATALTVDGDAPAAARAKATAWQAGMAMLAGDDTDLARQGTTALRPYDDIDDPGGRAIAEWLLSFARIGVGDPSAGEDLANRALVTFRALGDRWGTAAALSTRAAHAMFRGDPAALERDGKESSALFRELGDRWGQMEAALILGMLAELTGHYERAARLHEEGLRIAEEFGLWAEVSTRLCRLGRVALLTGDYARAEELHVRAKRLAVEQSNKSGEYLAELGLGLGARKEGRLDSAETHLRNCLALCRRLDADYGVAWSLAELGLVAEQRGDAAASLALHLDGHAAARASGDPRAIALALEGLAGARALIGHHEQAARMLGAATAARQSAGAPLPPAERGDVDRITATARAALGGEAFTAEFERGATLAPDELLPAEPDVRRS